MILWTAARQPSLSITNSRNVPKFMSFESVTLSNHLILCCPLLLLLPIPPSIRVFSMRQLFAWGSQSTGVSALASFLPKKPQGWSPSELIGWKSWITINWQIVKEMGIPDHLTYLLRILYASQEATVRTGHRKTDWFQIGKEVHQAVHCHPAYLTYMQSTSWETLGWRKHKLESRFSGKLSITSDMQMTPPLWQKVKKN